VFNPFIVHSYFVDYFFSFLVRVLRGASLHTSMLIQIQYKLFMLLLFLDVDGAMEAPPKHHPACDLTHIALGFRD